MKKLKTLFKKDPSNLGRVLTEIDPENNWVFSLGIATRKFDGTSCAILNGNLHKRYDAKINKVTGGYKKNIPIGAIACQEADTLSGHHPHWVKCERSNNADRYHFEAFDSLENKLDGTYELCGPKVQGNPENVIGHELIKHGAGRLSITDFSFDFLQSYLSDEDNDIEGIVFHHKVTSQMCKIRKSDFGIVRKTKVLAEVL